jgi:signal transduction histidine kinase
MKFSFERVLIIFFLIVIIGVVSLGIINFNANRSYFESTEWIEHTNEVIKESTMVLSTLQDMGVRGYITTRDTSFLESYNNAQKVIMPRLDSLRAITSDNKTQKGRVDTLVSYAMMRMSLSRKYIQIANHKMINDSVLASFSKESKYNMNHIRATISEIISVEQALLKDRKKANEKSRHDFNLSVALIFTEIVLLLIVTFISLLFYLYNRKIYENNILTLNADLAKNVVELNNANKELESFSYSVSHDLRAPLRIIDGFAKIMSEEYKNKVDGEGRRFLDAIRANAQHMGQLIDDLLNFSRISRQDLTIQHTDMMSIVSHVLESFKILDKSLGAEIRLDHIANASCDEHLIKQIWVNLLSNALKYSRKKDHPVIVISSQETDTEIIYIISDNGVGFDMEFSDKLFGVFQRLHKVSEYEGTGVGLALVNRIVSRHKGRVWAYSEPEQGATFYFSLPK